MRAADRVAEIRARIAELLTGEQIHAERLAAGRHSDPEWAAAYAAEQRARLEHKLAVAVMAVELEAVADRHRAAVESAEAAVAEARGLVERYQTRLVRRGGDE